MAKGSIDPNLAKAESEMLPAVIGQPAGENGLGSAA